MKYITYIKRSFLFVTCISCAACKKFIQVPPPVTQITTENVFTSDATATAAVVGLYTQIMGNGFYFLNGANTLYPALSADELIKTAPDINIDAFTNNAIPPESSIISNDLWGKSYNYIYQANACLQALATSKQLSDATRKQLMGEMQFTRALCYFYLVNLFGDVPLVLTTDYNNNASLPRTPQADVYKQVINDLKSAENLLGKDYVSSKRARPNKFAAIALLARVYLYQHDWNNAETEAGKVIGSGMYNLVTDLNQVFVAGSHEVIWQLIPVIPGLNTEEGATFIPYAASLLPNYVLTASLLASFEPGDNRKTAWLNSTVINGMPYYYPFKYKVRGSTQVTECNIVLRYAEQYLIRAEARAQQNNIPGALEDINMIRQRAGLPPLTGITTQAKCLEAIAHENQIEFFAEWGHRWLDLKRTGQATNVLGTEKQNWQPTDTLYPIPFAEIQSNIALIQNEGY